MAWIDDAKMLNLDGENKIVQFSFDESKENCIFAYNRLLLEAFYLNKDK